MSVTLHIPTASWTKRSVTRRLLSASRTIYGASRHISGASRTKRSVARRLLSASRTFNGRTRHILPHEVGKESTTDWFSGRKNEIDNLKLLIANLKRMQFGRSSEK